MAPPISGIVFQPVLWYNEGMKLNQYLTILAVSGILLANSALTLAEEAGAEESGQAVIDESQVDYEEEKHPSLMLYEDDFEDAGDSNGDSNAATISNEANTDDSTATAPAETTITKDEFLQRIKQELNLSKTDYKQLLTNLSDTKRRLEQASEEKMTLQDQLVNVDAQINLITNKLISVVRQIVEKENQIALLFEEIEIREVELEYQKNLLKDYIRILYQEENNFFTIDEEGSVNAMKLLLADGSVGQNLQDMEYLDMLNETGAQMLDKLKKIAIELEARKKDLNFNKEKLEALKEELSTEKAQLEMQKASKEQLMRLTLGQETIYNQLFEETLEEQEQVVADIKNLGSALSFVEAKMKEEGDNFDPKKYSSLLEFKNKALYDFQASNLAMLGGGTFIWPVDPFKGISAYFRDPTYVGVFGVRHNAIDIPTYQGTTLRAAADGVVYTTRDNGYGYSYIILAHANGLMTVYGHVSAILVEEGQIINQGSIIGLSGGMPGTLGAGYMTTGPHLHLEMLLNGNYVDPLDYLPLDAMSDENIERLPEKYKNAWEESKLKALLDPVARF